LYFFVIVIAILNICCSENSRMCRGYPSFLIAVGCIIFACSFIAIVYLLCLHNRYWSISSQLEIVADCIIFESYSFLLSTCSASTTGIGPCQANWKSWRTVSYLQVIRLYCLPALPPQQILVHVKPIGNRGGLYHIRPHFVAIVYLFCLHDRYWSTSSQ
jgi:hypothetical protein